MDPEIVGRDREVAATGALLDALAAGPRGLVLEGDPGIGKTAVWRVALADAAARGYRVLRCAGEQAEALLSFVGLADLVGDAVEDVAALPGPQRAALERALLRRDGTQQADARAIGVALHALLVAFGTVAPVLIAVDDVQWLDGATAAALTFAIRRLQLHPVGVLATIRTPISTADPLGLERALGPDRFARLRLGPLSLSALGALLHGRLGYRFPGPTLLRVARVSGGNPLFALELARALGPEPSLEAAAPLPVPDSLRELVAARVAAVPPEGREALLAAAALSHPTVELVERVATASGLAAAEEAGLVQLEGGRLNFAHPLYASGVYAAAATRRRRTLHRRLAGIVSDPEERARHLALASSPPDDGVADTLEAAAADAHARGAWDAAGELLELAHVFTPPGRADDGRRRAVRAAERYIHAGDRPRARSLLEAVLGQTPRGPLRCEALRLLSEIRHNEHSFVEAGRLLEEALEHADDPAQRVTVHVALAYVYINNGGVDAADPHAAAALEEASALADDGLLAEALAIRAMVDFLAGRGVDWSRVAQAVELEDTTRLVPLTMRPSAIDAALTLFAGRFAQAREKLDALARSAKHGGDESDLAIVLWWLSWLELDAGDPDAAASLVEEAATLAVITGSASTNAYVLGQRALVHARRGEAEQAYADAANAATICESVGFWQPLLWVGSALGLLELSRGNHEQAWSAVRELTGAAESGPIREPHVHQYLPVALEALVALGELARVERLLDRFEERARAVDRTWTLAVVARGRGQLLAARGELDRAEHELDEALAGFRQLEMPFEVARTLLVQGQVRRRRRQRRAAREPLEQALTVFERQGARLWAARARDQLARLGPTRSAGLLTPAEQRVAELAAVGNSNKQIAATLSLSVHTVELHLSHTYAKLGIHSRAQLTRRLAATPGPGE